MGRRFCSQTRIRTSRIFAFFKKNKDNWIYVDDCAEQLVRLALKETLNYSCFNTGAETLDGYKLETTVKKIVPNAEIYFDESVKSTPLIDDQNDERIRKEIDLTQERLKRG